MSTTVTYKCDRCKHEQTDRDKPRQFWRLRVTYVSATSPTYGQSTAKEADWCRTCMAEFGNLMETKDDDTKPAVVDPPKTMEDYIREIAREEIESQ